MMMLMRGNRPADTAGLDNADNSFHGAPAGLVQDCVISRFVGGAEHDENMIGPGGISSSDEPLGTITAPSQTPKDKAFGQLPPPFRDEPLAVSAAGMAELGQGNDF